MTLGVNAWRLQGGFTGVARYLRNVLKHWTLDEVSGRFDEIALYTPRPIDRESVPLPDGVGERLLRPAVRMLAWENLRFGPAAGDDVLFCPSYTRPLVARGRTVVTMHDATLPLHPELYRPRARRFYNRLYGWSARHATLIMTCNEATRQDLARCYGVPDARIRVVPLAADDAFQPVTDETALAEIRSRYLGTTAPFFFYIGKFSIRRNVPKLLAAFAELRRRNSLPHKLLVVGRNTPDVDVSALAGELGVADEVVHREFVPDGDLVLLYAAAEAFVLPSTFEAISLPAMEAQACGTPVIVANTPGLRETTGEAAYLMPKADVPELVRAMSAVATDAGLREELREGGLAEAGRRSWQRTARATLDVLAEAA